MMTSTRGRRRMPLHTRILLGLLVGAAAGISCNLAWRDQPALLWAINNVASPVGQVFLRMLFMIVVPLVFTSLALGVANLGDLGRVGRIGAKTFAMFVFTMSLAVCLGLVAVNLVRPGAGLDPLVREGLMRAYSSQAAASTGGAAGFGVQTFVNIVPRNPIAAMANGDLLALIFFTLVFGLALTRIPAERAQPVIRLLQGIGDAVTAMIGFAMKLAPIGVACLIFAVTGRFGLGIMGSLAKYVVLVLCLLIFHQFVVIGFLARVLAGVHPGHFFGRARAMMVTAFSTSSSNATLPTTIRTAVEEFNVPPEIAGFVLPLGATMNMNGTALFEGVTVLFLAQVFGVHLALPAQVAVLVMSVLTAIGVAGVPGGSIPLLVMVLEMFGIPGGGIALVLGVDRILDMTRTVPNVTGDLLTSLVVTRSEGMRTEAQLDAGGRGLE